MLTGAKAEPAWRGELLQVPDAQAAVAAVERAGPAGRRGAGQGVARREPAARGAGADRGAAAVRTILVAGGVALVLALFGTPLAIRIFTRRGYGQEIREDGPAAARHQARHPARWAATVIVIATAGRVPGRARADQRPDDHVGPAGAVPDDRPGRGRLRRRLHQDLQAAQPRPAQRRQAGRPGRGRRDIRGRGAASPGRVRHHPGRCAPLVPARLRARRSGVLPFVLWIVFHDRRVVERGEPDRRPGRAGHRRGRSWCSPRTC